jgi:hypothetical protein
MGGVCIPDDAGDMNDVHSTDATLVDVTSQFDAVSDSGSSVDVFVEVIEQPDVAMDVVPS